MAEEFMYKGGEKLAFALEEFGIDVSGLTVADLGCNVGGFTDCLLKKGAQKVYSVDTGYGILAWKLRTDQRVEVCERSNAMHWAPPEPVDGAVIDVGWTRQDKIIPSAFSMVKPPGFIVSLFKPQYEAESVQVIRGIVPESEVEAVLQRALTGLSEDGFRAERYVRSPLKGGSKRKGNTEYFMLFNVPDGDGR